MIANKFIDPSKQKAFIQKINIRNNLLPDVFDSYFKPRNEIHNLQTRNTQTQCNKSKK